MTAGLLVIATNKYTSFLKDLLESADRYFLPNQEVEYFIFTTNDFIDVESHRKINLIKVSHKEWPWMTLGRYKIFSENRDRLSDMDYVYYCDADMRFCDVVGDEILSDRVATTHPGFCGGRGTPETNPDSLACVYNSEAMQYFAGGFNGGSTEEYLKMAHELSVNIEKDLEKDIIAIWHDESHMNRYFIDNPPTKLLDPGYCYGESLKPPFLPRLIALDKNHEEMRSNNI